ncbi:MAG: flagellar hook-associated protein FlgK [Pseudomonadota bacterium]
MSISTSLLNGLSGMTAVGRSTEATSNNLANALTKGFTSKSTQLTSRQFGGVGVASINRAAAPELTAARRIADADAASTEPQADALGRLARALGESGADDSLLQRVELLESAFLALAETPESTPLQFTVVERAKDLAGFLNGLSETIVRERETADTTIAAQVGIVNNNIEQIDKINSAVASMEDGSEQMVALLDQRELLVDEINAILPVRAVPQPNNGLYVTTTKGQFILMDDPVALEFTQTPVITSGMSYVPGGGGALSGLTLAGEDITPGSGSRYAPVEGSLFGQIAVRDEITPDLMDQIDLVAFDLIDRFADPAIDPSNAAGQTGLFTAAGTTAVPASAEGAAFAIAVNTVVDPQNGGDPTRLRDGLFSTAPGPLTSDVVPRGLLGALRQERATTGLGIAGDVSTAEIVTSITEYTATRRVRSESEMALRTSTRDTIALGEGRAVGVNQDEELQRLVQLEQSYAANVQVIQTASRMLQDLLEIR